MRLRWFLGLAVSVLLHAQVIEFESNGLHYKTLTKGSVTVMFAYLPPHVKDYSIVQVSISNGSPVSWTIKPEDFIYRRQDGGDLPATPALAVVNTNGLRPFELLLTGQAGRLYAIDTSSSLQNGTWTPLVTNTAVNGQFVFVDAQSSNFPARFYRGRAAN